MVFASGLSMVMSKPAAGKARRRYDATAAGDGDDTTATTLFGWSTFVVIRTVRGSENRRIGPLR